MKKRILLVVVCQLFLALNGCSSDSGDNPTPEPPVVVVKTAKITSYSKNSGETGETISLYGENLSDKVSDIKITFDGVAAARYLDMKTSLWLNINPLAEEYLLYYTIVIVTYSFPIPLNNILI